MSEVEDALAVAAADDGDPVIRRRARVSLVVGALARNPSFAHEHEVVLDALSRDEASGEQHAADLLESLWTDWQQAGVLVQRLVPLFVQAIQRPDVRLVRAGLHAIYRVAGFSDAPKAAVAPLGRLLAATPPDVPRNLILSILLRVADRGLDISECANVLLEVVDGDDESLAYVAAQALGRHLAVTGNGELVTRLLAHRSVAVRQGIAEALRLAAHAAVDLQFAMSALNTAALDAAGGVSYSALRTLREAAFRGADIAPAREALETWSQRRSYSSEGWYPYLHPEDASDLGREDPGKEARDALRFGAQSRSR